MAYQKPNKEERNKQFLASLSEQFGLDAQSPYEEETIDQNRKFLIVCEGANTEVRYFECFPVVNKSVITVLGGYGGGKKYLVRKAAEIADKETYQQHEVWCVFDYDVKADNPNQKQDFDNAITMAKDKGYHVAFSNDCFELWIMLHYKYIQNEHHRTEYYDMLTTEWDLEHSYESMGKDDDFAKTLYKKLLPLQPRAIRGAKNLVAANADGRPYHRMNPCTTVFELVEQLNQYLRY
jgi:hypothetical protein